MLDVFCIDRSESADRAPRLSATHADARWSSRIVSCACALSLVAGCAAGGADGAGDDGDHADLGLDCTGAKTQSTWMLSKRFDKEFKTAATNPLDGTSPLASAYLRAGARYRAAGGSVTGSADVTAGVSLLGIQKEIVSARLDGAIESGDKASATADVLILEPSTGALKNVFHAEVAAALGFAATWDREFYETPELEISIVPLLTIGIIGSTYGSIQLGVAGGPSIDGSGRGLKTKFDPRVKVWGTARAGLGFLGIGAGAQGQLTLLDAQAPTTGDVALADGCLGWKLDSDVNIKSMTGDLQIYANLGPVEKRKTLFSDANGISGKFPVVHESGAVPLEAP